MNLTRAGGEPRRTAARQFVDRCPVCGAPPSSRSFAVTDLSKQVDGRFTAVVCTCGARWLRDPISPQHVAVAYGDGYYTFQPPARKSPVVSALGRLRQGLLTARYRRTGFPPARLLGSLLPGYPPPGPAGRVLDVGCGRGDRLARLAAIGWQAVGIDPSELAVAAGRSQRLDVRQGHAERLPFPDASFDAVLMSHSLEHSPAPRVAVREAIRVIKPGGHVVITTPNGGSPLAAALGARWVNWDAPRHYQVFDPGSLSRLVSEAGGTVTRVRGSATGWSWSESVRLWARDRGWRQADTLSAFLRPLATGAALPLNFSGLADEIEVVARRSTRSPP